LILFSSPFVWNLENTAIIHSKIVHVQTLVFMWKTPILKLILIVSKSLIMLGDYRNLSVWTFHFKKMTLLIVFTSFYVKNTNFWN
jgi:hypothetical protein